MGKVKVISSFFDAFKVKGICECKDRFFGANIIKNI